MEAFSFSKEREGKAVPGQGTMMGAEKFLQPNPRGGEKVDDMFTRPAQQVTRSVQKFLSRFESPRRTRAPGVVPGKQEAPPDTSREVPADSVSVAGEHREDSPVRFIGQKMADGKISPRAPSSPKASEPATIHIAVEREGGLGFSFPKVTPTSSASQMSGGSVETKSLGRSSSVSEMLGGDFSATLQRIRSKLKPTPAEVAAAKEAAEREASGMPPTTPKSPFQGAAAMGASLLGSARGVLSSATTPRSVSPWMRSGGSTTPPGELSGDEGKAEGGTGRAVLARVWEISGRVQSQAQRALTPGRVRRPQLGTEGLDDSQDENEVTSPYFLRELPSSRVKAKVIAAVAAGKLEKAKAAVEATSAAASQAGAAFKRAAQHMAAAATQLTMPTSEGAIEALSPTPSPRATLSTPPPQTFTLPQLPPPNTQQPPPPTPQPAAIPPPVPRGITNPSGAPIRAKSPARSNRRLKLGQETPPQTPGPMPESSRRPGIRNLVSSLDRSASSNQLTPSPNPDQSLGRHNSVRSMGRQPWPMTPKSDAATLKPMGSGPVVGPQTPLAKVTPAVGDVSADVVKVPPSGEPGEVGSKPPARARPGSGVLPSFEELTGVPNAVEEAAKKAVEEKEREEAEKKQEASLAKSLSEKIFGGLVGAPADPSTIIHTRGSARSDYGHGGKAGEKDGTQTSLARGLSMDGKAQTMIVKRTAPGRRGLSPSVDSFEVLGDPAADKLHGILLEVPAGMTGGAMAGNIQTVGKKDSWSMEQAFYVVKAKQVVEPAGNRNPASRTAVTSEIEIVEAQPPPTRKPQPMRLVRTMSAPRSRPTRGAASPSKVRPT